MRSRLFTGRIRPRTLLSGRERDVLNGLLDGKTYRQIGDDLVISVNTVSFRVKQIYQKLHFHSRAEAFALARQRH